MAKLHPQDGTARELVKRFCGYVFRLKGIHYTFRELFHDDTAHPLMEKTAHAFFLDLNEILLNYFLLEAAKLTDPITSGRERKENFTVANLVETIEWPPDCLEEIYELKGVTDTFRGYIKDPRNKLIAHYDKQTVISGEIQGSFPEGEDEKFLKALERMCNIMSDVAFDEPVGKMVAPHPGDVLDLKKALQKAIAFDKLFTESKGNDLTRLFNLLHKVNA
ncbi:MAG: hypothetical protein ACLGPL_06620 [Acidobacteriota bacterium]